MAFVQHIFEQTTDPVGAPTAIGNHWVNTSSGETWISVGTATVADWVRVDNAALIEDAINDGVTDKAPSENAVFDALALKANSSHTHALSDLTQSGASSGQVVAWNGSAWAATTPAAGYTDEEAQDAIGTILVDSSSVDFTYNDSTPSITAVVLPAGVDHDSLLNFVGNEHIDHTAVTITAGSGLSGGGDISANRTIDLDITDLTAETSADNADLIAIYDDSATAHKKMTRANFLSGFLTSDQYVKISSADTTTGYLDDKITVTNGKLSKSVVSPGGNETINLTIGADVFDKTADDTDDLTEGSTKLFFTDERAQDAVGTILTDSASVDFTYNDGANTISAVVLPAGVDHNSLQNYSANRHIDHSAVSISPGTGLTGGGDLTTTRTLTLADTAVTPNTYGSTLVVGTFTVDQQGRITAASNATIAIPASAVTNFDEAAQDAIGTILVDTSTIDLTYDDGVPSITADVINNSITDAKFRQSAALSVVGNATNATANVSDITASADNYVLKRSGTSLVFGTISNANIDASAAIAASKIGAGTFSAPVANNTTTVSFSGTVTITSTQGNNVRIVSTSNFTLANPTGTFADNTKIDVVIVQGGSGGYTITFGSKFRGSESLELADIIPSAAVGSRSRIGLIYDSTDDEWDVVAFQMGY